MKYTKPHKISLHFLNFTLISKERLKGVFAPHILMFYVTLYEENTECPLYVKEGG